MTQVFEATNGEGNLSENGFEAVNPPSQPEQAQPVTHRHKWDKSGERCVKCGDKDWMGGSCNVPDTPPPRQPLTDEEIGRIAGDCLDAWSCARAIEAAHGIRSNDVA